MIYVGLDDTDTLETPGTNQLARHIVARLSGELAASAIVRHQLLVDPRVPCTNKNGCVAIVFRGPKSLVAADLAAKIRPIVQAWCPAGSDPGLCVTSKAPLEVAQFGERCQRELVCQADARQLAARRRIYLEGLGGSQDGVIGALAAVGLASTLRQGRIIYLDASRQDIHHVSGWQPLDVVRDCGIEEVLRLDDGKPVTEGLIDLGKRLRPNYRDRRVVLYVSPALGVTSTGACLWRAERVV